MLKISRSLLAIAALSLGACSDDPISPNPTARLRLVHAVSNVAAMDMLINTTAYKSNATYKSHDGYRLVTPGTFSLKFRKVGVATDLVAQTTAILESGTQTVIALGTEAAPQSMLINDNNTAPTAGKVKIRAMHAAIGSGALDVYVLNNATELATATSVFGGLTSKSSSAHIERDAGTFVVIYTTAGTKTPVLTFEGVQIAAGKIRTFVAVEKAGGGTPLEGIVLDDN